MIVLKVEQNQTADSPFVGPSASTTPSSKGGKYSVVGLMVGNSSGVFSAEVSLGAETSGALVSISTCSLDVSKGNREISSPALVGGKYSLVGICGGSVITSVSFTTGGKYSLDGCGGSVTISVTGGKYSLEGSGVSVTTSASLISATGGKYSMEGCGASVTTSGSLISTGGKYSLEGCGGSVTISICFTSATGGKYSFEGEEGNKSLI
ncbi:hypothetical protein FF38_01149 [Lucilia cuprina]|uniref:Uncharacterized protein n=1 Tax=Lucilia cuprina TaxID=7375 RepID=A0A0L0C462_LUCCU|nr:hypothetical protein FF38_01149 [Lucilia cuprina]